LSLTTQQILRIPLRHVATAFKPRGTAIIAA
jgi:hypothetical protein